MTIAWNNYLELPETALDGRRIPKTAIVAHAALSKKQQKTLGNLRELHSFATLAKSNTGIPAHVDEDHDIQAVLYLSCLLNSWQRTNDIVTILHRTFPNPTVLLIEVDEPGNRSMVSVGLKRKSLAEESAVVLERVETIELPRSSSEDAMPFWQTFRYPQLSQHDLLDFVTAMQDAVLFADARSFLGFIPQSDGIQRAVMRQELLQFKRLDREIVDLQSRRRNKDLSIGESAEIRVLEASKKEEAQILVDHIKELCHD
ncbi:DUF4391 domain-containing protein [Bifidobacterium choloepi]|uniref:DUF4391 domain-containing protein n=1 Tax=Bifidobacterium choloepi TaxID=2614131 RepID=A0A6I5NGV5_9BIFI|nr:DUF4391 domain-containing protein [Bifidobacterium choloepi]NEG69593.1 DUF4391 domain-containing protein [Bifidobacterium choloepi]